jgi:hypothetical protein
VRPHRHAHAEERRDDVGAEERLVPLVVRVRDQRDACRDQLRPRRSMAMLPSPLARANSIGGTRRLLAILELGLRHRRTEVHVPERRRLELVGDSFASSRRNDTCDTRCARRSIVA